jgi:MFS family permease
MTTSTAIVQLRAAPEYRGRVLALQAMVFLGSTPIGGPIVGWISDTAGPRVGIVIGGVACLAAAAWGHRYLAHDPASDSTPAARGPVTGPQPVLVTADDPAVTLAD